MECANKSFSELAKDAATLLALSAEVSSPTVVHHGDFPATSQHQAPPAKSGSATGAGTGLEPAPVAVSNAAGNIDPSFARPARLERDIALAYKATRAMRELLLLASDPAQRPDNWPADGDAVYLNREISPLLCAADPHVDSMIVRPSVLRDPEQMKQLSMVLFVAARRPPESDYQGRPEDARDAVGLWDLERDILKHLVAHKSIHLYVVVPLPGDDRNYANLVLARPLNADEAPIGVMDACTAHSATVSKTAPRAYRWVNIHSGAAHNVDFALGGNAGGDGDRQPSGRLHFTRTKCIDYGEEMPPPLPAPCLPFKTKAILPRSDLFPAFQALRHGGPVVGAPAAASEMGYEAYAAMSHAESGGNDDTTKGHTIDGLDVNRAAPLPLPPQLIASCYGAELTKPLRFTSCMGHNSQAFYKEIVMPHLARRTGLRMEWVEPEPLWHRGPWRALTGCDGQPDTVDVVAMCGVEFGRGYFAGAASKATGCRALLEDSALRCQPLAAPVVNFTPLEAIGFTAAQTKAAVAPVPKNFATEDVTEHDGTESAGWYTSVLICRRGGENTSAARPALEELAGKKFAVNEAASWSGCMLMRLLLSQREEQRQGDDATSWPQLDGFFGEVVPSGSHMASLNMVLAGDADCALIDAAVLAAEMSLDATRAAEVAAGVVAADVPELESARWPMPPIVASRERLCPYARGALQRALVEMASRGGAPLSPGHSLSRFVAVGAAPYRVLAAAYEALSPSK